MHSVSLRRWVIWGACGVLLAGCLNRPAATPEAPMMVYRSAGALQCEPGSGRNLAQDEAALAHAGIASRCARVVDDGRLRIQQCGTDSGRYHRFQIAARDLPAAEALGFQPLAAGDPALSGDCDPL